MNAAPVNQDEIRMLVQDVGFPEASRRSGIKQDTLYKWSKRKAWNTPIVHAQATVQTVQKPADMQAQILAEHEHTTRLTLAKYASNAAAAIHKSVHPTRYTKHARDLASVMATVHRQDEGKQSAQFSLNVLNLNMFSDTDGPT